MIIETERLLIREYTYADLRGCALLFATPKR